MKHIGRHVSKLISMMLVLVLLIANSAVTVLAAAEAVDSNASTDSSSTTDNEYTANADRPLYSISYKDGKLTVLFKPDLDALKDISRETLTEIKNDILDTFWAIIKDSVNKSSTAATASLTSDTVAGLSGEFSNVDITVLTNLVDKYITSGDDVAHQIENEFLVGTYDAAIKLYVDQYAEKYVAENQDAIAASGKTEDEVKAEVVEDIRNTVTEKLNDAIVNHYDEEDHATVQEDTDIKVEEIFSAFTDNNGNYQDADVTMSEVISIVDKIELSDIKEIVEDVDATDVVVDLVKNSTQDELVELVGKVDTTELADMMDAVGLTKEDIKDVLGDKTEEELKEIMNAAGITVNNIREFITLIETVKIDGATVYDNGDFILSEFKNIIKNLPSLQDIANRSDAEMRLDYDIAVHTSLFDVDFELVVGFDGDCDIIRSLAKYASTYLSMSVVDGVRTISINVPSILDTLYNKVGEGSAELQQKLFTLLTADVETLIQYVKDLEFDDIISVLETIDFVNNSRLKNYIDLSNYTNEQIINKIKSYSRYFEKAKDIAVEYLDQIPARYRDISVVDYYNGNGDFSYHLDRTINVEKIASKIHEKLGAIVTFVGIETVDVNIKVNVSFDGYNRVTFKDANGVVLKDGFLPKGASIVKYAPEDYVSSYTVWKDINGVTYTTMPDCDIELSAYTDIDGVHWSYVEGSSEFVYDGTLKTVFIDPVSLPEGVTVEYTGNTATNAGTYTATAVLKSVADGTAIPGAVYELTWTVEKAKIDMSDVAFSDAQGFVYNGQQYSITLNGLPAGVEVVYGGSALTQTNAGEYTSTATFSCDNNHELINLSSSVLSFTWYIAKQSLDMAHVNWINYTGLVYDGIEKTVMLKGLPTEVSVEYAGNSAINAGAYTATATLSYDKANYTLVNYDASILSLEWTIAKKAIDMSGVNWIYADGFVYNGSKYTVTLNALPGDVDVVYSGNEQVNAGNYTATVTFNYDNVNYALVNLDASILSLDWAIAKKSIDMSAVAWSNSDGFVYNGSAFSVFVENLPDGITASYDEGDAVSQTNAGTYNAIVNFVYDTVNIELVGLQITDLQWSIAKATIDMSGVSLTDKTVEFDGKTHSIIISGELPEGVTVSYVGNGKNSVGVYTVTAKFTVADADNYNAIEDMTATLTIKEKGQDPDNPDDPDDPIIPDEPQKQYTHIYKDQDGNIIVKVQSTGTLTTMHVLNVKDKTNSVLHDDDIDFSDFGNVDILVAYDITFTKNGIVQSVSDSFTVSMLIPEDYVETEFYLVYIAKDGTVEEYEYEIKGDYVVFETDHFSTFALIEVVEGLPDDGGEEPGIDFGDMDMTPILIAGAAIAAVVLVVLVIVAIRRRRYRF